MKATQFSESGLGYLKQEAIDAHTSGDGMRVIHICVIALVALKQKRLKIRDSEEIHWAFSLGLYWMLDDWFLHLVEDAAKVMDWSDDDPDFRILKYVFQRLQNPVAKIESNPLGELSAEYLERIANSPTHIVMLTLAFELGWFALPTDSKWKRLAQQLQEKVAKSSDLSNVLRSIATRLSHQSKELYGDSSQNVDVIEPATQVQEESWLMKGWRLFFDCQFTELDELLDDVNRRLSTSNPYYIPLLALFHMSRIFRRRDKERDQLLSLSRRRYISSRQPAIVFRDQFDSEFERRFSEVARRGFSNTAAYQRFQCFRISMLSQLHSLRSWDLSRWLDAQRDWSYSALELGSKGDTDYAKSGVVHTVRSNSVPALQKVPQFDNCMSIMDAIDEQGRAELVTELLSVKRFAWRSVNEVFARLSSSIPARMLNDVAEWSVRYELDDHHSQFHVTSLEHWSQILPFSPNRQELIQTLFPALNRTCANPRSWHSLHDLYCHAIRWGSDDHASQLLQAIISAECPDHSLNAMRFSIIFNVAQHVRTFSRICEDWLQKNVDSTGDPEYYRFVLRHLGESVRFPVNDPVFRKWLREKVIADCDRINSETEQFQIGGKNYHSMILKVTWPASEKKMIQRLLEVANADHVPYSSKVDPIVSLAWLSKLAPKTNAKLIAENVPQWLKHGVPGIDLNPGTGPLSLGQFQGFGHEGVKHAVLVVADFLLQKNPELIVHELSQWAIREGARQPAKFVGTTIRIVLQLSLEQFQINTGLAVGLVGIAEAASQTAKVEFPVQVIDGYRSILFTNDHVSNLGRWIHSAAGNFCLDLLQRRLIEAGVLANPDARQAVARTMRNWKESEFEFPDELLGLWNSLREDPRLSVRDELNRE